MSWVAAAVVGGAVVGGAMSNRAAGKAAKGQTDAANAASQAQLEQFYQSREDQAPWLQSGTQGVGRLSEMLGLGDRSQINRERAGLAAGIKKPTMDDARQEHLQSHIARFGGGYGKYSDMSAAEAQTKSIFDRMMGEYESKLKTLPSQSVQGADSGEYGSLLRDFTNADFVKDPGYDFRLSEGNKAVENAARARGTYMSPMTVKELLRYGQDYASNEFGNAYNRDMSNRTTKFNMLSGISGTGQTAANTVGTQGANAVSNVGQLMTGAANARGAAGIAGANAWNNGISNIGNWYTQQQWMKNMFPQQQSAPAMNWGNTGGFGGGATYA